MHTFRPRFVPASDRDAMARLRADHTVWREVDLVAEQLDELAEARSASFGKGPQRASAEAQARAELLDGRPEATVGTWVYYPWSGVLVRLLEAARFRELRLDRNRDKITTAELAQLATSTVGVVGLSVGNAVALTLAQEGVAGTLVLADFDVLGTSNLNRVRAAVADVGLPKTVVAARQIAEIDPFVEVRCLHDGLTDANLGPFLDDLDVVVDECDGLGMKLRLREAARKRGLPVVMETSDRGTLDVERFDHEATRPLLHGLVPDLDLATIDGFDDGERLALVARMVGYDVSTRAAASMLQIGATLSTWPQLASDVALGGATVCAAVRRILLDQPMTSGRRRVDLGRTLDGPVEPRPVEPAPSPAPEAAPPWPEADLALLRAAMHAPSGGNCQPWHFVRHDDRIDVHHLRARSESLLDADGFAGLVSVGMAVEGMALEAAQQGRALHMETTGATTDHVATLTFSSGAAPDALHTQLGARFTDRRLPDRVPVPSAVVDALRAHLIPGLHVDLVTDPAGLDTLGHHIGAVDGVRFLHPGLHREMWEEVRWSDAEAKARPDGISLAEMAVGPDDEPVLRLLRRPDVAAFLRRTGGGQRLGDLAEKWVASAAAVGLLWSDTTDPASLLAMGRQIHRLWLEAVAQGFAIQPIGVAAYMIRHLETSLEAGYLAKDLEILRGCDLALADQFPGSKPEGRLLLFRLLAGGSRYAPKTRRPLTDCGS